MLIRQANAIDLPSIIEIEKASFAVDAYSETTFRDYLENYPEYFCIADTDKGIVGYIIVCVNFQMEAMIVSIAISPTLRRQGIGRMLVEYVINELHKIGVVSVELKVRATNEGAIQFWKLLDFVQVAVIPDYYKDGASAIVMIRAVGKGIEPPKQDK